MRSSCPDCVRKHIAQAIVLLAEARLGYPTHVWLAMAHIAEAEQESIEKWPEIAFYLREQRLNVQRGQDVILLPIIALLSTMVENERHIADQNYFSQEASPVFKDWMDVKAVADIVRTVYLRSMPDNIRNDARRFTPGSVAFPVELNAKAGSSGRTVVMNALGELEKTTKTGEA